MGIVFLTGLGAALSADAPEPVLVSAELRGRAAGEARGAPERWLARAEAEASKLESRASRLAGVEASGREALGRARRRLSRAEGRLASAEGAAERYSGLLDKQEEGERREAAEKEAPPAGCDPNYTGCLDPNASDYDCEGGSGDGPRTPGRSRSSGPTPTTSTGTATGTGASERGQLSQMAERPVARRRKYGYGYHGDTATGPGRQRASRARPSRRAGKAVPRSHWLRNRRPRTRDRFLDEITLAQC